MNLTKLYEILAKTTVQLRKGEALEGTPELVAQAKAGEELTGGGVLHVYNMPHTDDARQDLEVVDVHFVNIGVDRAAAETHRSELLDILREYPDPDELAGGPSYISVGARIGDQGAAFQLFALGKALKLWDVITPKMMGFEGREADNMAGAGFVMCTGLRASS